MTARGYGGTVLWRYHGAAARTALKPRLEAFWRGNGSSSDRDSKTTIERNNSGCRHARQGRRRSLQNAKSGGISRDSGYRLIRLASGAPTPDNAVLGTIAVDSKSYRAQTRSGAPRSPPPADRRTSPNIPALSPFGRPLRGGSALRAPDTGPNPPPEHDNAAHGRPGAAPPATDDARTQGAASCRNRRLRERNCRQGPQPSIHSPSHRAGRDRPVP